VIRFTAQSVSLDAAAGEEAPTRQISGIAVPYNVDAIVSGGQRVRILPGAIVEGKAPRLLAEHDHTRVVGMVTASESDSDGLLFTAKIADPRRRRAARAHQNGRLRLRQRRPQPDRR